MNEALKYQTIKLLVDTSGNKKAAALRIGCSVRHINRMISGYRELGKAFFIHGNQGRQPARSFDRAIKQLIVDLYRTKYFRTNFQRFQELLAEHEKIHVSISVVRSVLASEFILSPKANRITKKNLKNQLEAMKQSTASKKSPLQLQLPFSSLRMLTPGDPVALSLRKCCKWTLRFMTGSELKNPSSISPSMTPRTPSSGLISTARRRSTAVTMSWTKS